MRATVNGIQIEYTDEGTGVPLLFLHSFPLSRFAWTSQVDAFKPRFRVIAPDLRAFGEGPSISGPTSMNRFAEDLHDLLQHLVTGPIILAGHAMGGSVALAFASLFPKFLRGLVLVGMNAGIDSDEATATRLATAGEVARRGSSALVEAMAPRMLANRERPLNGVGSVGDLLIPSSTENVMGSLFGRAEQPDMEAILKHLRVPTLIIAGSEDALVPPSNSEALAKLVPGAQLNLIPRAGHLVAFEQAAAFNEVVRNWLAWGSNGLPQRSGQQTVV